MGTPLHLTSLEDISHSWRRALSSGKLRETRSTLGGGSPTHSAIRGKVCSTIVPPLRALHVLKGFSQNAFPQVYFELPYFAWCASEYILMFPVIISLQGAVGYKSHANSISYSAPVNTESLWTSRLAQKKENKTITDHIYIFFFPLICWGYGRGNRDEVWGGRNLCHFWN